ncbi:tetratricopeptide repeat protein [Campylobacter sp. 2018MI35]|uniref:motility protein PflB n=1 Tax=Campylobacter sp. 2018MI34 TaxID=2800582 RepID=UPI0019070DDE|nr:tetratricopeptide repeat protein [Campylobacter sp. 2018MI34]MBK1992175.1 tetratricopeptide repeat protein [Campylobacter sp. 2018MI34]
MAEEKIEQEDNLSKERLDESLEEFKGQEGEAPQDEELTTLPEELSNEEESFFFKRESAPKEEQEESLKQTESKELAWYKDKKFLSLIAGSALIICSLVFTLFYLSFSSNNIKADIIATTPKEVAKNENQDESYQYDIAKIDTMIKKANALYLKGDIEQALKAYEQIAIYNESLSSYNLGVSQMNENQFEEALQNFKKAINNGENQTVSAINAAVCALKLNDRERFKYYIDLAQVYLPKEGNSKLYDYYLALINFYKGYYPEALQMFQKTSVEPYADFAKYLSAKIYSKMDLNSKAISYLKEQNSFESSLSLGLLYARIGEYQNAKNALNTALKIERDFNKSLAAITLVDLKTGQYQEMLTRLNNAYKDKEDKYHILDIYKIKVNLNKDLFDIQMAQENFSRNFFKQPKEQFDLLFYYAPYQVFDSKQSSLYIKKANITYFIDDSVDTSFYLKTGRALSSTNVKIANIVNLALNQKLKQANKGFQDLIKEYPEHSILHYNLALTYAQLKNYDLAYKHFSSSYHLNPKNYLAGAFAMFCAKISGIDTTKFYNEVQDNLSIDTNSSSALYKNLFFLANEDYTSILPYLDETKQDNHPLNLIFEAIAFKNNNLNNQANIKIAQLKSELPNDVLTNILYFNSLNTNQNIKDYAQNAQIYFQNAKLDYKSIFGGAIITREKYTSLMQIAGLLNLERKKFKDLLNVSNINDEGLIQTLAYIDIFSLHFEEAYALYNTLIDNYKANDSHTLFLASVAAIGSNNPNSAIALLQLAKLSDNNNKESKAALGLLYQQVQNYEPALLQYKDLPDNFKSEFFTFEIKE